MSRFSGPGRGERLARRRFSGRSRGGRRLRRPQLRLGQRIGSRHGPATFALGRPQQDIFRLPRRLLAACCHAWPQRALILANTLRHGARAGLATLAGTAGGLSLLAAGAALGMSSLKVFLSQWFDAIPWAGALDLIYLATRQLWALRRGAGHGRATALPARGGF